MENNGQDTTDKSRTNSVVCVVRFAKHNRDKRDRCRLVGKWNYKYGVDYFLEYNLSRFIHYVDTGFGWGRLDLVRCYAG